MPKSRHGKSKRFKQEKRQREQRFQPAPTGGPGGTAAIETAPVAQAAVVSAGRSTQAVAAVRKPAATTVVKPPNILPELRLVALLSVFILAILVVLHLVI